eukprot:m.194661 g.194661  ORF g.194661 m.194661 type:complete len:67 (+) comp15678_c0_seq1:103-303(+)
MRSLNIQQTTARLQTLKCLAGTQTTQHATEHQRVLHFMTALEVLCDENKTFTECNICDRCVELQNC